MAILNCVRFLNGSPFFDAGSNISYQSHNLDLRIVHGMRGNQLPVSAGQVAALVLNTFCNFYSVKNHKIANNSATTEAREKISIYLESLEFQIFFMHV